MANNNARKEVAGFLINNKKPLVKEWSNRIFEVPGHKRLKTMIPKKIHAEGMKEYIDAFIKDIKKPSSHYCNIILKRLVLNDYLSANTAEDTIHGQIILRDTITSRIIKVYSSQPKKLNQMISIILGAIERSTQCLLNIYKTREFSRLKTVMKYGKKLIAVHDLDKLCKLILEAAIKESDSDRASIMLLEKDGYLHMRYSIGIPRRVAEATKLKLGKGIAGRVAKTATPLILNAGQKIPPRIKKNLRGLGLTSAVVVPLIADSKVLGVLNLGKYRNKPFFDEEDVELLVILAYEAGAAISNCYLFEEVHDLYVGSIVSLAAAIDARDHYTHGHSKEVAKLAVKTAQKLKLDGDAVEKIHFASMLHDIGKIGIPDNVLLKKGKLTRPEWAIIKKHPIYGAKILKHIPRLKPIIPIIYHEHERYDGTGYVDGIKGEDIPIESRIIAVADAYEAMTSRRPYRKPMPKRKAIEEIKKNSGTQFDPRVVRIFLKVLGEK
ncbi:MAG: GAF domain-containing protein [Candidatus Omnitrophica bacterium]|nr:GAF domain-containing protein [Candidatus Omnitrophota bacterium]